MRNPVTLLVALIVPLALTACGGNASNLLGIGSSPKPTASDLVTNPVNDPKNRAVQVAWNVSRAAQCGFNLDPVALKQNYLTYESGQGMTPDLLPALEKTYEFSRIETASRISKIPQYCNDTRVRETRTDLGRYLAGDFAARRIVKKEAPKTGIFDAFDTGIKSKQVTSEEALATKE